MCNGGRLPPCGGSGLKYGKDYQLGDKVRSPSMRREWIEIPHSCFFLSAFQSLPPCGGSGLKWSKLRSHQLHYCLPPCGGSGLKYGNHHVVTVQGESPSMRREWIEMEVQKMKIEVGKSPSMRREWIEIPCMILVFSIRRVSLHAEGVD